MKASVQSTSPSGLPWSSSEREQAQYPRRHFWLHLRPARLPAATLRWSHTMGLGGSSLVLLALLALTGALQLLVYVPSLHGAWDSVRALEHEIGFGALVRGIHYWSANLLLIVLGLHVARVLFMAAFRDARRLNWWIGLALLLIALAMSFTGYLLPLDQRAWWAVTVAARMLDLIPVVGSALSRLALGGDQIDGRTIVRFTTFHTTLLPLLLGALAAWHFWRVRRAKGVITPPGADSSKRRTFFPHLFVRELAQTSLLFAMVVLLAATLGAPLGDAANPGLSPNPVKAPWYFVGWQELLIHVHPLLALVLIPIGLLSFAVVLPRVAAGPTPAGRWFLGSSKPIVVAATISAAASFGLIVLSDRSGGARSDSAMGLVVPLLALAALFGIGLLGLRRWMKPPPDVLALAMAAALISAGLVLTLVGEFLRGQNMALIWPG